MIERLKSCIKILFAKQYIVFTADKNNVGKGYIHAYDQTFIQAAVEVIKKVDSQLIADCTEEQQHT